MDVHESSSSSKVVMALADGIFFGIQAQRISKLGAGGGQCASTVYRTETACEPTDENDDMDGRLQRGKQLMGNVGREQRGYLTVCVYLYNVEAIPAILKLLILIALLAVLDP